MKHKLVIAMTAATLFLVGCGQRQHTEQVTLVRIDTVKTANTCDILEFPARVQAAGEVHLAFKIPGTLQRIYVDDGAFVRQGELVAEMDPRDYELQLQAVEAEYLSIKAEAERVMALYDQNVATADAYDKARYGLQQITAKYENARNQLADTKLYAPFDGYVKRRRFDPPTVVAAGMPVITFLRSNFSFRHRLTFAVGRSLRLRRCSIFCKGKKFRCVCSMSIRAPMPISFTPCGWHCP